MIAFEWDDAKDATNAAKHGIGFLAATKVFDDPLHLIDDATTSDYGEVRWKAIGRVDTVVFAVIFTDQPGRRRIISARRARRDERERYHRRATAT